MRVLHVIPSISEKDGGPSQAIFPMCAALRAQGADVIIASTDADIGASSQLKVNKLVTHKGVPVILFAKQFGSSLKYSRAFSVWLDEHVSDYDLVHIHAVFNHACVAAARACRRHDVPYVVRPLGTLDPWSMNQKPLRKSLFWKLAGQRMLRDAAAVHYTARAEQQAVEESLGLNHGRVVPLGVDINGQHDQYELAAEFPELVEHPYVLVLSRLHSKKRLEVLLDAFVLLARQEEFSNWRLVIAGDGEPEYAAKLRQQVDSEKATELVLFTGWLDGQAKEAVLRNAALLALPSRQENFGLCVLEALAYGVPVLISPHVNLAEDIQAAGAGWVTPVDKESIAKALAEAMRSAEKRRARGEAGRKFAAQFAWPSVAAQLKSLYGDIVGKHK